MREVAADCELMAKARCMVGLDGASLMIISNALVYMLEHEEQIRNDENFLCDNYWKQTAKIVAMLQEVLEDTEYHLSKERRR